MKLQSNDRKNRVLKVVWVITVTLIVVSLGLFGRYYSLGKPNIEKPSLVNAVKKRARRFFRKKYDIKSFYPLKVKTSICNLERQFFESHEVFNVIGKFRTPPSSVIIAVGKDQETFILPMRFEKILHREKLNIDSSKKALNLTKLYLCFSEGSPEILKTIKDIPQRDPAYSSEYKDPSQFSKVVGSPKVNKLSERYEVTTYTWRTNRGMLSRWEFVIKKNGGFSFDREVIAEYVGDYTLEH